MGEDQDFLFRAALAKPIAYSPKVLALYVLDSENRACINNVPKVECPFSKRLMFMVNCLPLTGANKKYLKKCAAAHLLHLVRKNFESGQIEAGYNLLRDARCNLKPLHKTYWLLRYAHKILAKNTRDFIDGTLNLFFSNILR